jgi:hypothetical protein
MWRRGRSVLLPPCGWLVDEHSDDGPARHRRPADGDLATRQAARAAIPIAAANTEQFQRLMADHGVVCSMSNVWDNSAMESFLSSLKIERTAREMYRTSETPRPTCSITLNVSTIRNDGTRLSDI